jgi:carbon monoxide dehydrogenase subunit G
MIEVNERIEVSADPQIVWNLLSDPRAVVDCVPGASLGEQRDDGSYDATLVVRFGPAKVTFKARVALDFNAATMSGHVASRGRDDQGGTKIHAAMDFRVEPRAEPAGSSLPIDARVEITGKLAAIVESGAGLVVKRMTREFSERLAARCAGAETT